MAITTGISDGLKMGHNTRAAIITRGLVEITRIGTALGAKPETFSGLSFEKGIELVEQLETMTPKEKPLSLTALRWILDFEAVSVVIPGSKMPEQVLHNCSASDLPSLTPSLHKTLNHFYKQEVASAIRGKY